MMAPDVLSSAKSATTCREAAGTACAGVLAVGKAKGSRYQGAKTLQVKFGIYAFDTAENAKVAMKAIVNSIHREDGKDAKVLKVDAGADESDAVADRMSSTDFSDVTMRVGGVVVRVHTLDVTDTAELESLAKMQVERIKRVAAGKNPDA
ncbi:hypothetical protein [Streptomyces cinnamoneus]|nr:hypothetical protein [Streptomyces cinnamoneus]